MIKIVYSFFSFVTVVVFQNCVPMNQVMIYSSLVKALDADEYEDLQLKQNKFYVNPILQESGDPDAISFNGKYYIYLPYNIKTSVSNEGNYKVFESTDLISWNEKGLLFANETFSGKTLWAPNVHYHKESSKFYLYYGMIYITPTENEKMLAPLTKK